MAVTTVNEVAGGSSWGPAVALGPVLQAAASMYEQLKGKWNHESPNLSKCSEELGRLKLVLLELNFLPTTGTKLTKQQLILARECHWGWWGVMGWGCGRNGGSGGQGQGHSHLLRAFSVACR